MGQTGSVIPDIALTSLNAGQLETSFGVDVLARSPRSTTHS